MDTLRITLESEADTVELARDIAIILRAGDALLLSGPLGAGKSVLARAAIRHVADNDLLEVPSPTYTLCQEYDLAVPVSHFDLYRIGDAQELEELGLGEALELGAIIVEWPEQGLKDGQGVAYGDNAVTVTFTPSDDDRREVTIKPFPNKENAFSKRLVRSLAIRNFLSAGWKEGVRRRHLQGDASARRYETAQYGDAIRVLMDAPAQPDGPPVRNGLPYSRVAHLAEDIRPFVAIAQCLREKGYAAPAIHAGDLDRGLLLIEHLGAETIAPQGRPEAPRYLAAARLLAQLHGEVWPECIDLSVPGGEPEQYRVPDYDDAAMGIEVELFADWYVPGQSGKPLTEGEREGFKAIWTRLISDVQQTERTLVLRDYHSPNIIWRPEPAFPANLGLIDFQDAVFGPPAYDLASLAQDARVDIGPALESEIVAHYLKRRSRPDEESGLRRDYAIMAAQRATKILGIFVRLHRRDGKDGYLKHLPRMRDYLRRNLQHEALAEYRQWLQTVKCLPAD